MNRASVIAEIILRFIVLLGGFIIAAPMLVFLVLGLLAEWFFTWLSSFVAYTKQILASLGNKKETT